jgi:GMP synthase PP-ATPase subunit
LSVNFRAISVVRSVLSLSTTMISSAQERDARAASMFAASLKVMTVAVTGTLECYQLSAICRRVSSISVA